MFAEHEPVRQTRKGVVVSHMGELGGSTPLLGDVLERRDPPATLDRTACYRNHSPVRQLTREDCLPLFQRTQQSVDAAVFKHLCWRLTLLSGPEHGGEPLVRHGEPVVRAEQAQALAHVRQCRIKARVLPRDLARVTFDLLIHERANPGQASSDAGLHDVERPEQLSRLVAAADLDLIV